MSDGGRPDPLREAATRLLEYRQHTRDCEVEQTDFCTCGMKQAADALRAALGGPQTEGTPNDHD